MKTIVLLHPFSAKAIGLHEKDLYYLHSKPHENALKEVQGSGYKVHIDYFTGRLVPYSKKINGIHKRFWPLSTLFSKRHVWRNQLSWLHLIYNYFFAPELTIVNMSGHGSPHTFKLAKILKKRGNEYIAMIGGMNIHINTQTLQYYKNAHHVIVHTQIQKEALNKMEGFPKVKIEVMPLGIDTSCFKIKVFEKNKKQNLLYVGRISRLKQIELAIDALAYSLQNGVQNISLTVIGPFSDADYYKELIKLVKKLKLEDNVTFVGTLTQDELIPYYQNASVLLLPSAHESFGMVMVEAMACGTPVIALKGAGGPDEIVEDGNNGFLCSKESFKEKVFELVNSKTLRSELSIKSRSIAENKWSLEHTTRCMKRSINAVFNS